MNTYQHVYVERRGILETTTVQFRDDAHLMSIIDRIVSAIGRRVDESSPMVDARLADGSRVNAIIPPLAVDGPCLSIRRFGHDRLHADDLVGNNTLTAPMLELLAGCVKARLNILISGGTGAGKTTLLNVLSSYISDRERIVTIEDAAELQLHQEHVVRLETRPPNIEGKGRRPSAATGDQLPAYAPRPHHHRRGPRRRSAGHAAGHEHRPRRFAHHDSRQFPARCAEPPGNHGGHGQFEYSRERYPPPDRLGDRRGGPGVPSERRHPQSHNIAEITGMEGES